MPARKSLLLSILLVLLAGSCQPISPAAESPTDPAATSEMASETASEAAPESAPKAVETTAAFDPKETVLIPAGPFQMGCSPDDRKCETDEVPLHEVTLDGYRIDKYEVTNARYQECVDAGACSPPGSTHSETRTDYYGNPEFANFPVLNVDWHQAGAFCQWDGGRLPTEAEWVKAARGSDDTRIFPWGNAPHDCTLSNSSYCVGDTVAVGSYPTGASPYGVMDMGGNVAERVSDWYQVDYYTVSPAANPQGPEAVAIPFHVTHGGSWRGFDMRTSLRGSFLPTAQFTYIGFRCVRPE